MTGSPQSSDGRSYDPQVLLNSQPVVVTVINPADHAVQFQNRTSLGTFGDMAGGLVVIPIWIPQSSLAIGSFLLFVAVADQFVHVLRGNRPDYVVAVEERHARGDFSEDV